MEKESFSKFYQRVRDKKSGEKFFNMKTEPLTTKKDDYLKPVKVQRKGGYPRGTRPGDGGLAEEGLNEVMFKRGAENEEQQVQPLSSPIDQEAEQGVNAPPVDNQLVQPEQPEDPNRAGLIRKVNGAHLVYKRQAEDGTYEELWISELINQDMHAEVQVKNAILAGTDIDPQTGHSEDGTQQYEIWQAGNAQMIHVIGLPN